MNVRSLSAVVFFSTNPDRLAAFYNQRLGMNFAVEAHGPIAGHHEARLGEMRFAILPGAVAQPSSGGVCPTFLVNGLDAFITDLKENGVQQREPILSLGGARRLASFRDIDGNGFQLLDLGFVV